MENLTEDDIRRSLEPALMKMQTHVLRVSGGSPPEQRELLHDLAAALSGAVEYAIEAKPAHLAETLATDRAARKAAALWVEQQIAKGHKADRDDLVSFQRSLHRVMEAWAELD